MYIDLALPLPIKKLFTYAVPENLKGSVGLGSRVLVQLGKRFVIGVVVNLDVASPQFEVKEILSTQEEHPLLGSAMLDLTKWMSEYYFSSWGECLKVALPQHPNIYEKIWVEVVNLEEEKESLFPRRNEVWEALKVKKDIRLGKLVQKWGKEDVYQQLQGLQQMELVRLKVRPSRARLRNRLSLRPENDLKSDSSQLEGPHLDNAQRDVIDLISEDAKKRLYSAFLLLGRSEPKRRQVYLESARRTLQSGKQALVLLPEASLIGQVVSCWRCVSKEKVATLHSQIPISERLRTWHEIKEGRFPLVVGTRLAVFAPLENLGFIAVEEETHPSHKEESSPYYNARDVAVMRGRIQKASVILSSGYPSLESFYNCKKGKYKLCDMNQEDRTRPTLKVEVIDRRKRGGKKTAVSPMILDILKKEKRPMILLLNRRGFSRWVVCQDCGFIFRCPKCGISLVFHRTNSVLRCHYCGHQERGIESCPKCGGKSFSYRGFGTENLEQVLKDNLPQLKSVRLDRDVSTDSSIAENILWEFQQGRYQVLLGTQMIFQGLDLSKVGLFIIISMDEFLAYPDFRSKERAFHFLARTIEKIAEANPSAKLVIGTSQPQDPVIRYAIKGDYVKFLEEEMEQRRELFYPPFSHLISISLWGRSQEKVASSSTLFIDNLHDAVRREKIGKTQVSGPATAFYARRRKQNEWRAIVKTSHPMKINRLLDSILQENEKMLDKSVKLKIEVDPLSPI